MLLSLQDGMLNEDFDALVYFTECGRRFEDVCVCVHLISEMHFLIPKTF